MGKFILIINARISVSIVMVGVLIGLNTRAAYAGWPYSDRYEIWTHNHDFPLGSWYEAENPPPSLAIQERVDRYQQAGYTRLPTFWKSAARPVVENIDSNGMDWQILVDNVQYQDFIEEALTIGNGPSAIMVFDEPVPAELQEVAGRIHWAQQHTQIGVSHAKAPLVYANLSALEVDLDQYLTLATPDVFSYDRYPLFLDGSTDPDYFREMGLIREKTLQYKIPMWMIQQAWSRTTSEDGGQLLRKPSESDMRFQAFAFLGHGGLGIDHFIYLTTSFPDAVIDYNTNQPSQTYYAIQDMSPEILNLGKSLPLLKPVGDVEFLGHALTDFNQVTAFEATAERRLYNIEGAESALVSFFVDESGEEYFMVVNLKHGANLSKVDSQESMLLFFDPTVISVQRLNRITGDVDVLATIDNPSGGNRYLPLTLEGGTGDLFKYNTGAVFVQIPEPASMFLWLLAPSGLLLHRRRSRSRNENSPAKYLDRAVEDLI